MEYPRKDMHNNAEQGNGRDKRTRNLEYFCFCKCRTKPSGAREAGSKH